MKDQELRAMEIYQCTTLTNKQIAKEIGVGASTIWRWADQYNWRRPKDYKQRSKPKKDELAHAKALYERSEMTMTDICKLIGRESGAVARWALKYGWKNDVRAARRKEYRQRNKYNRVAIPIPDKPDPKARWPEWARFDTGTQSFKPIPDKHFAPYNQYSNIRAESTI